MVDSRYTKLRKAFDRSRSRILCRKPMVFRYPRPLVSFTFDDFPATAYRTAGRVLEGYGFCGTYYTSMGLLGTESKMGKLFSVDDLLHLNEAGHEIGCHTFRHNKWSEQSLEEFERDLRRNAEQLTKELPELQLDVFSCPNGVVKPRYHRRLSQQFRCIRTIIPGINRGVIDLNHVRAVRLYDSEIDELQIRRLLSELADRPGWLVFYTHDVRDNPSQYGVTPALFESAVEQVAASQAEVCTVSQTLDRLGAPPKHGESRPGLSAWRQFGDDGEPATQHV